MWVPGKDRRRMRREQDARVRQMRADFLARQQIEQELAGGQQSRPRRASAARRLTFRGRRVLLPFLLLAVLGACGWLSHARGMTVLAMPALWLLASTAWWFRRGRLRLDRAVERQYAGACIGLGALWLVLANLGVGPVWLTVGWTLLALPWWRHHWPHVQPAAAPVQVVESDTIPDRWAQNVGAQNRKLPGAVLHTPGITPYGKSFVIQAVPGKAGQQKTEILGGLPAISQGLKTPMERVVVDDHPDYPEDPSVFRLQIIDRSPIKDTVYFTGPVWRDGKVWLGPHADGIDEAVWRVYAKNSMFGGLLTGGTGSGKTRLSETLAVTVRDMSAAGYPTTIVYLDGQDGASSPMLWEYATWRAGPQQADDVLAALERGKAMRQKWNRLHGLSGFTPGLSPDGGETPGLPGVLVIVDECHAIFNPQNALRWANVVREVRKVGMGVTAEDQYNDLEVFGGKEVLRSSLIMGNAVMLRTTSRMSGNLMPGMALDPSLFPDLPGYGYKVAAPNSGERTAPFRARYAPDESDRLANPDLPVPTIEEWFAKTADAPLDEMTARAFGPVFLDRHALAEQATRAARDEIEGRAPVTIDLASVPAEDDGTTRGLILAELAKGEPVRPVELERLTGKSKSSVKQALNSLKADGMVRRLADKGPDGYSVGYVSVQATVPAA